MCIDQPNKEMDDIPGQSLPCLCIGLPQVTLSETTEKKIEFSVQTSHRKYLTNEYNSDYLLN